MLKKFYLIINRSLLSKFKIIEAISKAINANKIETKNTEKAQFTGVNEHFEIFFNEDIGSRMVFEKASNKKSCLIRQLFNYFGNTKRYFALNFPLEIFANFPRNKRFLIGAT